MEREQMLFYIYLWFISGLIFYIIGLIADKIQKLKLKLSKMNRIICIILGIVLGPITLLIVIKSAIDIHNIDKGTKKHGK